MPGFYEITDVVIQEEIHYPYKSQPDEKHDRYHSVAIEQDRYAHQDSEEAARLINIFSNPNPSFIQPNCRVLKKISFAVIKYTFMGYYAISTDGIYR